MNNPCTRCGKPRIASKSWEESTEMYGRKTTIKHVEFSCTNPDCQKIVSGQLLAQKVRKEQIEDRKIGEKLARDKQRAKNALKASHL